ncbi:MAG TPA: aldo/keto reductase [Trebonia sp.]|jgi:aryl-alcohol dehydrogenase-like predicted oxidoreductase|nr:aldo/keto reductase [Trebonia sp.]
MIPRRQVGRSGLQCSVLSLGAMTLGDTRSFGAIGAEPEETDRIIGAALDGGIDTFDTANVYGDGDSEKVLGRALRGRREDVILATKVRFPPSGPHPSGTPPSSSYGLSRRALLRAVEDSLRRLETDWIDILWFHMQDRSVPIEETLATTDALVKQGKVRYFGLSNFAAYRTAEAVLKAEARGFEPVVAVQVPWSLVTRDAEREIVPAAVHFGLGVTVYSPLARGFLTGKYRRDAEPPEGSRLAEWRDELRGYDIPRNWTVLDEVRAISESRNCAPGTVALAWLIARRGVSSVIIGARTEAQLKENIEAAQVRLTRDEVQRLNTASEPAWGYPYDFIGRFEPW